MQCDHPLEATGASRLGWLVELQEPSTSVIQQRPDWSGELDAAAVLAQAHLYLFDAQGLHRELERLRRGSEWHQRLAHALAAEDALRRGELASARETLVRLRAAPGPVRAWAGLRDLDALERLGRVADAERGLLQPTWIESDEPPLLRQIVEARLRFRRGEVASAASILEAVVDRCNAAPAPLVATFHRTLAIYLSLSGELPRALLHHRSALDGFKRLGDLFMLAKEYLSLGQSYLEGDELDHAEFFLHKAGEVIEQFDNAPLAALHISRMGMLALMRGELSAARELFERDLRLSDQAGFRHGQAFARRNLGRVLVRLGEPEQGAQQLRQALADFVAMGDSFNEQLTRVEQACALLVAGGDVDAPAIDSQLEGVAQFMRRVERPELLPLVEAVRALLYVEQGKRELAENEMAAAARTLLAQKRPERVIELLLLMADTCLRKDWRKAATQYLAWAYRESVKAARPWLASVVLGRLGRIDESVVMDLAGGGEWGQGSPGRFASEQLDDHLAASRSPAAQEAIEDARRVAPTDETVLIEGETGAGKGVLAQFVHAQSRRSEAAFIALNCGAIVEALLESELFGHEKGAFTGADARRVGVLEAADGGTVFLDEIGELSARAQVTLLRFLEDRQVRPVGSSTSHRVDVRVIAATNRDLRLEVREGRFRQDLYFRLAVYPIRLPPLRERLADLPELVSILLARNPHAQRKGIVAVSKTARERLAGHHWPGNLRELDNVLRAAAIRCRGKRILRGDLPPSFAERIRDAGGFPSLVEVTQRHIQEAMRLSQGNRSRAAALLGVHRNTLRSKLAEWAATGSARDRRRS